MKLVFLDFRCEVLTITLQKSHYIDIVHVRKLEDTIIPSRPGVRKGV